MGLWTCVPHCTLCSSTEITTQWYDPHVVSLHVLCLFALVWSVCSINILHWSAVSSVNLLWVQDLYLLFLIQLVGYLVPRLFLCNMVSAVLWKAMNGFWDGFQLNGKLCTANTMNKPSAPWGPCYTEDGIEYVTGHGDNLIWRMIPPGLR